MADYTEMWKELGLDLPNHDGLLNFLGEAYQGIYLTQKNRPKAMDYFDFVISEIHGLRVKEIMDARKAGKKGVGTFCVYVPEELVLAAGGIYIGLCAGAEVGTPQAEQYLPRNTCALIKAFFGFKLANLCPYSEVTDLIIGETTCDGKKKAYEAFNEITGKVHVMDLPNTKSEAGRQLWLSEVKVLKEKLEALTGNKITPENLAEATIIVNNKRKALQRLSALRTADPAPISGLDSLLINQVSFYDDPVRFTSMVNKLCDELELRVTNKDGVAPAKTPRILISGSPMAIPNWKVHHLLETSGAIVVGEESCVGSRNYRTLSEEKFANLEDALKKIADRYLTIDCACFTPNNERLENIVKMRDDLKADGVIHYSLQFCTLYTTEGFKVAKELSDFPYLRIETDYSMEDAGQLKTRIEAFLEMIKK